jgi:hypothetical protein
MGNGSDERDERGRHSELNHDCVTRRRRATNIFKVLSSFEGSQYQLRHLDSVQPPGTLRKNVALVQKSCKTSVEQSFFAGCPS